MAKAVTTYHFRPRAGLQVSRPACPHRPRIDRIRIRVCSQIRATVSCPNRKAIRLPTMETYIMVSAAPSAAPTAAVTPSPSPSPSLAAAVGRTAAPTSHVHDMPVSAEQRPQIRIDGPGQQLVSYQDIKHGVRILRNATVRIVSGQRVRAELQQLDSCAVTVFPSLNPDHESIAVLPPPSGDAGVAPAHRFRTPLDIKTAVGKEGVELIGCVWFCADVSGGGVH